MPFAPSPTPVTTPNEVDFTFLAGIGGVKSGETVPGPHQIVELVQKWKKTWRERFGGAAGVAGWARRSVTEVDSYVNVVRSSSQSSEMELMMNRKTLAQYALDVSGGRCLGFA